VVAADFLGAEDVYLAAVDRSDARGLWARGHPHGDPRRDARPSAWAVWLALVLAVRRVTGRRPSRW
jgi:hypothetical protein